MSRDRVAGYTFLVIALLLWGGNTVIGRFAVTAGAAQPVEFNFWRWTVAALIMAPFAARRIWTLRAHYITHWRYYALFGFVGVTCFNTFYYIGLQTTTAVQGSLITAILPILVLMLSAGFARLRITGRHLAGLALSIGGAALVVVRGDPEVLRTFALNVGDLWCLGAVLVWAVQTFMLRFKPPEADTFGFTTVSVIMGTLMLAPLYAIETAVSPPMIWNIELAAMIVYAAIGPSAIAFTLWSAGTIRIGPTISGYIANLFPVFSALLAVLILGEAIAWYHGLGGGLVLGGIFLATLPSRARRAAETPSRR